MRLLKLEEDGGVSLANNTPHPTTPYAILSHTWGKDNEEVTFEDLKDPKERFGKAKIGYKKLQFCGQQAALDGLQYFWVDTCCINKSSDAELSEALNSMFRWYHKAARCYVYLADVRTEDQMDLSLKLWEADFGNSLWFTRGWTLQELLAPPLVEFFSSNGDRLGDKKSLEVQLHKRTGIPVLALRGRPLSDFSFDERKLWAENRTTKREEDLAYSLLGIFDISIPVIYGEGKANAYRRLNREWRYHLDELSEAASTYANSFGILQQTLEGHSDLVKSVAFSPDSKMLASASVDKTIQLWDAATYTPQRTLQGHSGSVRSIAFSPDSKLLASASGDKTVRLWVAATGVLRQTLEGHESWVLSVSFSPDSRLLASASDDMTVRLWDTATGGLLQTLKGHSGSVRSVAFSSDSKLLASASYDKTVRIWNVPTGTLQQTLRGHSDAVNSVDFSHDSQLLVSASNDKIVRIWDVATSTLQQTLEEHSDWVLSVAFSPDSRLLASASDDETVRLWEVAKGTLQQTLRVYSNSVRSVAFSPDSRLLATASGKMVQLWGAATSTLS